VKEFSWTTRVYWEDTDGGGIVYYANYLKFLERARTEWLRARGYAQSALLRDEGIVFAVVKVEIDYRRPARLDDALTITCEAKAKGSATVEFQQSIYRDTPEELLTTAQVRVVCLDAGNLRPTRLPPFIIEEMLSA
jgi:acyl-CoA thioester hydrolase